MFFAKEVRKNRFFSDIAFKSRKFCCEKNEALDWNSSNDDPHVCV
jgi:hypothetical protein